MSWPEFFYKVLYDPPWALAAIILALIVAHIFNLALGAATRQYAPNIIGTLECFLVFILGLLTWYLYEESMSGKQREHFYDQPISMVILFIVCTFFSIVLYGFFRKFDLLEKRTNDHQQTNAEVGGAKTP